MKKLLSFAPVNLSARFFVLLVAFALLTIMTMTAFTQNTGPQTPPSSAEKAIGTIRIEQPKDKSDKTEPPVNKQSPIFPEAPTNTANYVFTTATDASLTDMSSGTTQLLAANIDDTASALTSIGFDFFFQGARFTQFSINDNGVLRLGAAAQTSTPYKPLAQAGISIITAYGADQRTHAGDGKVHFKVIGAAPNRTLVIEWLNNQANFDTGGAANLTYQVRLSESTGVIEFVYGSMTMSTLGAASTDSRDPHIGFSSTNTAGNVGSVTAAQSGTPAPTFNGASATPVANLYTAGAITVLTSAADGSRRIFTFTAPTPAAPTALNFTSVGQLAMTLNWTDSADELLYAVYRSTDGINFAFDGTAAQNATSYAASSLSPGVTYFWRVFAVSEGALSTALAGSQATAPAGNINSTPAGGNWSAAATWVGGVVPGPGDNATIVTGATVTIDSSNCLNLTIQTGAILQFEQTTARTLTVGQSVTVDSGGTLQSNPLGTVTTHILSVGTDLTNNGTIDFSTNGNTAGAGITFTGATDASFTLGGGSTTDLKQTAGVVVNKGTNNTPVLSFTPGGTITVLGANAVGFLTVTNGTFRVSGSNTFSNPVFNAAAYSIPATGGFRMDNPNATVVGLNGSPTVAGLFRMSQGTFNIGTGTGNSMGFASGANINVEGGAINATGRFGVAASGNAITYNQTGGTITVCTIGNASTTLGSFDLGTGVGTTNIIGGTIICQLASTAVSGPRDFRNQSGLTGTTTVTGGTVQLGNAASGAAKAFSIAGVFPNLVLSNASAGHSATFLAPAVFNNVTRNITINTGNTLNIGNNVFLMNGATLTNNGTLTANGASSNFVWFLTTAPQLYTGSGTVTAPVTNFAVQSDMGLTIDPASSNIVVGAIRLFSGSLINSNKITLGNGGATTGIVQIGNTTTPTAAGTFDVPFTFNLGTGGQTISYLRTTATRTTGPEINPARTLTSMTYDDNDPTHSLTIAGGDLTLASAATALTMTNGRVITGTNTLILSSGTATVTRTNGYVDGNFRKTYAAAANKNFEVGTANGFSPVAVNVTAGTFPATFTAKAVQGPQPNISSPQLALQRYWTLTATGVTADLTFTYLDPVDIPASATEANFVILKFDGVFTQPGGTVNTGANTANITGVTSFSDWTLAEPAAPTAVELESFDATGYDGGAFLQWKTGTEINNLGFNLYRDEGGKRTLVNKQVIAGSALVAGSGTRLGAGRSYGWWDPVQSKHAVQYWLEDRDLNGKSTWHGPVFARQVGGAPPDRSQAATLSKVGQTGTGETRPVEQTAPRQGEARIANPIQASLAGKPAVKLYVKGAGMYRVTGAQLMAAGLNPATDTRLLRLFADGVEQPVRITGGDEQLDPTDTVEFYGVAPDSPYTDARVYWMVGGAEPGLRLERVRGDGAASLATSFLYSVERRDRAVYFSALRNGERENFFGAVVAGEPADQSLDVAGVDQASSQQATLEVVLQGVTHTSHTVRVQFNGAEIGIVSFDGHGQGVARLAVPQSTIREGENNVRLIAQGGQGDVSLVDYIRLSYWHTFAAEGDELTLVAQGRQQVTVGGFTTDAVRVFDVTNPDAVQELEASINRQKGEYGVTFAAQAAGERSILAISEAKLKSVAAIEANRPSSWRVGGLAGSLLIITHGDFISALEPLKVARQNQGYKVAVVDVKDIYDEFTYGQKTPYAIKEFLSFTRASWKIAPRYLLMAGDASFDAKNYLGFGDADLVPTKLIDTSLMEASSDDWFADFDLDGLAEMSVGRLPARVTSEASVMIAKIVGYDTGRSSEEVLLVSDVGDTFNFEGASGELKALVPGNIRVNEVSRGRVDAETAKKQLLEAIRRGQKIVNYTGHGSVDLWRGNLLTADDVRQLANEERLPIFVMMTCLNGYFHDAVIDSLSEGLMKSERGGAVAAWASTGMTWPDDQALVNRQLFREVFNPAGGQRLGDATTRAKAAVTNVDVRRTWILLGDPTMRLR